MDLAQVSLIHLLPEPTSADLDSLEQWKKELLGIQDVLAQGDRSLDSFCLPVASATSVNIQQTCENAMQLSKSLGREFQTGVYFDTATMCKLSAAEIAEVQAALQQSLPQVIIS